MRRDPVATIGAVAVVMAAAAMPSASALPQYPDPQYVRTAGNVRCVISADRVACERMGIERFLSYPATQPGGDGHVASVNADGTFNWADAGIGGSTDPEVVLAKSAPYRFHGWVLLLEPDGTRVTNVRSLHGMLVSVDGATVTPY